MHPARPRDAARRTTKSRRRAARKDVRFRSNWNMPAETLEVRIVPSTATWTGADGANSEAWSDAGNWAGGVAPSAGDDLVFPATAQDHNPYNDFAAGTSFSSITLQGTGYDLTGNGVELTGLLNSSYTSGYSIDELATQLDGGQIEVDGAGTLYATGLISGVAGSGLDLVGGGTLALRGAVANTYTGTTTVDSGTLILDNISARYAVPGALVIGGSGTGIVHESLSRQVNPAGTVTINGGSVLNLDGSQETIGPLTLNGNAAIYTATSDGSLPGLLTLTGDVTVNAPSTASTINGVINLGAANRTFDVTGGLNVYATVQGSHALIKAGPGAMLLQDSYQDAGAVDINGGTLNFNYGGSIDESSTAGIAVAPGGTMGIYYTGSISVPVHLAGAGYNGSGALLSYVGGNTLSNVALTADATVSSVNSLPNSNLVFSGAIGDGGSGYALTATGTGLITLAGANTYTGGTFVNGGLLYVQGSILGAATAEAGGQLGGDGTIGDAVTSGGTVGAGGLSIFDADVAHFASLTLDPTGTFQAQLDGLTPGGGTSGYDQVVVAGAVALDGAHLSLPAYAYSTVFVPHSSLTLIQGATSLTGTFNGLSEGAMLTADGVAFRITYQGGEGGHDVVLERVVSTTTTLTVPTASAVYSQPVTFTATVAATISGGAPPTGTVTFHDGATVLGTGALNASGVATITTTVLPVGNDLITATYNTDPFDLASTASAVTQQVFEDATTSTPTTSGTPTVYGQPVTITATVVANAPGVGHPSGTVTFYDGTTDLGNATLDGSSQATYVSSTLTPGGHNFSFTYAGDGNFLQGYSSTVTQTVTRASTSVALASSGSTVFGQSATFTATVTPTAPGAGAPTGSVTFYDGATAIGTGAVDGSGVATFRTSALPVGTDSITAVYGSDADFAGSTSSATSQVVAQAGTSTTLTGSPASASFSDPITLTATVAAASPGAGAPTGTVTFYDGDVSIGTGAVDGSGVATLVINTLSVGSHTITAVYGGDGDFLTSTSTSASESIDQVTPTTTVATSPGSVVSGQPFDLVVTIAAPYPGAGTPSGTVTVYNGATSLGTATLDGSGVASIPVAGLGVGTYPITVTYGGDANFASGTSAATNLDVLKYFSTAAVAPPTATAFGQAATLSVTVAAVAPGSGTPTGSVTFYDGTTSLGTVALDNTGTATLAVSSLGVGTHAITAGYGGDANFQSSNSPAASLVINRDATTATVAASADPSVFGQPVTFTATVAPVDPETVTPTGAVTFFDGATPIGTGILGGSGTATLVVSDLGVGSHAITAVYGGDGDYATSTSSATSESVDQATSTVALASSSNPSVSGQPVTLTATVAAVSPSIVTPTGTVTFFDGATSIGTGSLNGSGVATLSVAGLGVGSHAITAVYGGDPGFIGSSSPATSQVVGQASTTVALASTANPSVSGQSVTFTATVAATAPGSGTPTGIVTFLDGSTPIASVMIDGSGAATLTVSGLGVGSHAITAFYGGDIEFLTSASSATSQVVGTAASSAAVAVTQTSFGLSSTITATVAAVAPGSGIPTGTVTFFDGATFIGTGILGGSGTATLVVSDLGVGSHAITAVYGGDGDFQSVTSPAASLSIVPEATTATSVSSVAPSVFGQPVTFTATVTPDAPEVVAPTGTVTFFDGETPIGTGLIDGSGVATLTVASLGVGSHPISAVYGGDPDYAGSTSSAKAQVVDQASTSATLAATIPTAFGQPATFTATVAAASPGAGAPTGTVTFYDGATAIGAGALDGSGVATLTVASLGVGSHPISAVYGGDGDFLAGGSAPVVQHVNQAGTTATLAGSAPSLTYGQPVTFTATVLATAPGAGTATGVVTFYDGSTAIGTGTLDGLGAATLTLASLDAGSHAITATYAGDPSFLGSTASAVAESIAAASTSAFLSGGGGPTLSGQPVTLTADVVVDAPGVGIPAGSVVFRDGANVLGSAPLVDGTATFVTGGVGVGSRTITATFQGGLDFLASTSNPLNLVVSRSSSTTTLSPGGPSAFGQPWTFTATVAAVAPGTGTPTGPVIFEDGGTPIGTAFVNGSGVATFADPGFSVGTHAITAFFAGDDQFVASTSPATVLHVATAATALSAATSQSPVTYGQSVTWTVHVGAVAHGSGVPSGTVGFFEGTTPIDFAPIVNGVATFTTSGLDAGSNAIHIGYSGDPDFAPSTAADLVQVVVPASTYNLLASSSPSVALGQPVTYTGTVYPYAPGVGTPTGTMTFYDGPTPIGTATLIGGRASLTATATGAGLSHDIVAVYVGDADFGTSTSHVLGETVTGESTTLSVVTSQTPVTYGQSVTWTAHVGFADPTSVPPSGTVGFFEGTTPIAFAPVVGGVATFTTSGLDAGSHTFHVGYSGDANFLPSTASDLGQVVVPASTYTLLTSSASPAAFGQPVTYTATIHDYAPGVGTPTGSMTFLDGSTPLGTVTLIGGQAQLTVPASGAGLTHDIIAAYPGDGNFGKSSSFVLLEAVAPASTVVQTSAAANAAGFFFPTAIDPVAPGAGVPTGTVTLLANNVPVASQSLVNGYAGGSLFATAAYASGKSFTLLYSGDANFAASESSPILIGATTPAGSARSFSGLRAQTATQAFRSSPFSF